MQQQQKAGCQTQELENLHWTMSSVLHQVAAVNYQEQLNDQMRQRVRQQRSCFGLPATESTQVLLNCPGRVELENRHVQ